MEEPLCPWCGLYLYRLSTTKTRKYCSSNCRKRAYERRLAIGRGIVLALLSQQGGLCARCKRPIDNDTLTGANAPVADHTIPVSRGGADDYRNIKIMHAGCNAAKKDIISVAADVQVLAGALELL